MFIEAAQRHNPGFTVYEVVCDTLVPAEFLTPEAQCASSDPEGDLTMTLISPHDKWTFGCQKCIAVLAKGTVGNVYRNWSVLFHVDPISVSGFASFRHPPLFQNIFTSTLDRLAGMTRTGTRLIGIAGGYMGEEAGKFHGTNRNLYNSMVQQVRSISKKFGFQEPVILQPPKLVVAYTDVYWRTQDEVVYIITRPDPRPQVFPIEE